MLTKNIILSYGDYDLLKNYVSSNTSVSNFSLKKLTTELRTAEIVESGKVPKTVVQLNSKVKLYIKENKQNINVSLVLPSQANIKENKISIYSPMGAAIIGYEKGDEIAWEVPAGLKTIKIVDVINQND
ncbi:MAG: transcription elongation factor GreAB [Cyclobacteriaceae bacterium]|nr:transcription elongation factor GreAB [Cyclobacteriaceae bacterium]